MFTSVLILKYTWVRIQATPHLVNARLISTTPLECGIKHQYRSMQGYSWVKQLTKLHQNYAGRKGTLQNCRGEKDKCTKLGLVERKKYASLSTLSDSDLRPALQCNAAVRFFFFFFKLIRAAIHLKVQHELNKIGSFRGTRRRTSNIKSQCSVTGKERSVTPS